MLKPNNKIPKPDVEQKIKDTDEPNTHSVTATGMAMSSCIVELPLTGSFTEDLLK